MTSRPKRTVCDACISPGARWMTTKLATLSESSELGRLENYAAFSTEPHLWEQDGIGVCVCLNCAEVIPMSNTYMCYSCLDTCCVEIAPRKSGGPTSGGCPANVCDKDQCAVSLLWYDCVSCNEDFCGDCESSGKITVCRGAMPTQDASNRFATHAMRTLFTLTAWFAMVVGATSAGMPSTDSFAMENTADAGLRCAARA